ncbi:hypothetical protein LCGC14_0302580 [marine sediment metagenome]|uniref:C2H2-type domain-containing protein n=1 Tax=marine sediment metagenome TaxID=412755 RepID=A0A0F9WB70_9ZZZZ
MLYHCGFTDNGVKYCVFESDDLDETVNHVRSHAIDKRTCPLCQFQFAFVKSLRVHLKRKLGIKQYSCICCKPKKKFVTRAEVQNHERSMSGTRDFSCNVCRTTCSIYSNYKTHLKSKHHKRRANAEIDLSKYTYRCEPCMVGFSSVKEENKHKVRASHLRIINYVPV